MVELLEVESRPEVCGTSILPLYDSPKYVRRVVHIVSRRCGTCAQAVKKSFNPAPVSCFRHSHSLSFVLSLHLSKRTNTRALKRSALTLLLFVLAPTLWSMNFRSPTSCCGAESFLQWILNPSA